MGREHWQTIGSFLPENHKKDNYVTNFKYNEKEIQNYIWSKKDQWVDLIDNSVIPPVKTFSKDLHDMTLSDLLYNRMIKMLEESDTYTREMELIGCEVSLSKDGESTIRADFLGVFLEEPGIAIIELKKTGQTERQAFTELLAYGNHISSVFPFMSKNDTRFVLIAPLEERITREAVLYTMLIEGKFIFYLIPYFNDENNIASLRLKPWVPDVSDLTSVSKSAFNPRNFRVFKQTWDHDELNWNGPPNKPPPDYVVNKMNNVSAYAAQLMEEQRIHGFVYTSQLWSELSKDLPLTNSLVIIGINPFQVGIDLEIEKRQSSGAALKDVSLSLMDLIPGLVKNSAKIHQETDYLLELINVWDSHLIKIAAEAVKRSIQSTSIKLGIDHGTFTWETYQINLIDDVYCNNFSVRPTGLIRTLYWDTVW